MLTKDFWAGRHFPLLEADKGAASGGGSESESKTDAKDETKDGIETIEGLGDAGKEALRKERDAKKAEAARAKAAEEERDALKAEKAQREAAETKRKEQEAAEAGKFEELAATRERERDEATTEATSLRAENDQLKAAMKAGVEAQWNDLPEFVRKIGEKFAAEDDVLGRWTYLHDDDVQKHIKDAGKEVARGNGRDPKSNGNGGNVADADKQKAQASLYNRF